MLNSKPVFQHIRWHQKKWKKFYKGCREIMEVFQIYGMAADEVEVQTPYSLSALMHAHGTTSKNFYRYYSLDNFILSGLPIRS